MSKNNNTNNSNWDKLKKFLSDWKDGIDFNSDFLLDEEMKLSNTENGILEKILNSMDRLEQGDDISYTHVEGNLYYKNEKFYKKIGEGEYKLFPIDKFATPYSK